VSLAVRNDLSSLVAPHHRAKELVAIDDAVAVERGYWTLSRGTHEGANSLQKLKALGIPRAWRDTPTRVPGLVIPVYGPKGDHTSFMYKPDNAPKDSSGKPLKYGQPSGRAHLDVHPRHARAMIDPTIPVWITEGIKKADSITSRGGVAIAISGVWNWRGSLGTLGEWEEIVLRGREVIICFDSDTYTNRQIALAMKRFGKWVHSKGAKPTYVITPQLPDNPKAGADDWFVATGGTLKELLAAGRVQAPPDVDQIDGEFSDAILGQTLCDDHLDGRFTWTRGLGWLEWTGQRWSSCTDVTVSAAVRDWCLMKFQESLDEQKADPAKRELENRTKAWRQRLSSGGANALLYEAKVNLETRLVDGRSVFDADPDVLNTPNGVVDLRTGKIAPRFAGDLFRKVTAVTYTEGAEHWAWTKALEAIPEDIRDWVQTYLGQAITGHPSSEDQMGILYGQGENGKTAIMSDGIRKALGDYFTLVTDKALHGDGHETALMSFMGARLAVLEETEEEGQMNMNRLKRIVGTPVIRARYIRQDEIEFDVTHTLAINTNHLPVIKSNDAGSWRRLVVIPFPYRFRKPGEFDPASDDPFQREGDLRLKHTLRTDEDAQAACLSWLVQGAVRWYENGMVMPEPPKRIVEATAAWRQNDDVMAGFLNSGVVEFAPNWHVMSTDLLAAMNEFLRERGMNPWADRLLSTRFGHHPEVASKPGVEKLQTYRESGRHGVLSRPPGHVGSTPKRYSAWTGLRFAAPDAPWLDWPYP
jgi:putative DNA primase/helicase